MPQSRDNYRIASVTVDGVNFALQRIADRLDKFEGIRGTTDVSFGTVACTGSTHSNVYVVDTDGNVVHSFETG